MSRSQLQDSEAADLPDKAVLATVFSYLKNKNLKETEEALRKELSIHGATNTSALEGLQISTVGQSGIEPVKFEDSYSSNPAPLLTTCSKAWTTVETKAEAPQLAQALSPSVSPVQNDTSGTSPLSDNHHHQQQVPELAASELSHHADLASDEETSIYSEEEEEDTKEDSVSPSSGKSSPVLLSISAAAAASHSPTSSPPPAFAGLSNGFDKSPLWASKNSTCLGQQVPMGLGSGALSGISAVPSPAVHSSIPLSRPMGVRNVIFQSTPVTTGTVGSNKNMAVQVPMMYQLAAPSSLLAPLLTMVPPSVSSVGSLAATGAIPSATKLVNSISGTPGIEALLNSKSATLSTHLDTEKVLFEKDTSQSSKKLSAEPSTGQTLPYSDAVEFGSTCSSPAASSSSTAGSPAPRTLASIPHSELTPEQVELKGFAEDFKTRRIKLGFTQGSVGQSLAERGYSNFAQSTISRFEQMQLSPSNAATIRVVLEQWLIEAETPESASSSSSVGNLPIMASRKRKKRAVFTPQTKSTLDVFFLQNPRPNRQAIEEISQQLDLLPEEVRVWFCNKRQKSKPGVNQPVRSLSLGNESSSGMTSPTSSPTCDGSAMGAGFSRIIKRRSASPPHRTPFTIEELSKSSSSSTNTTTSSPIRLVGQSFSPISLVPSDAGRAKLLPMVFGQHIPMLANTLASPFILTNQIAKTKA